MQLLIKVFMKLLIKLLIKLIIKVFMKLLIKVFMKILYFKIKFFLDNKFDRRELNFNVK